MAQDQPTAQAGNATSDPIERPPPTFEAPIDREELREKLAREGEFDIVVTINTKDVDTTIIHVLNVACSALAEHFPTERCLVAVVDGGSTDQTLDMATYYPAPQGIRKMVVPQLHGPGKGNGIHTAFEIADITNARALACVDGDLVSIRGSWIDHLLRPIVSGLADLVTPYYLRDKWDGIITNHMCYPFNVALYGSSVRQPIGGDYAFSRRFISHLLDKEIPPDFGIDLFLTTTAVAEGFRTQEAPLGIKVHASTTQYTDPKKVLSGMYHQVVGSMLTLASRYEDVWRREDITAPVLLSEVSVPYYARLPQATKVNEEALLSIYHDGLDDYAELLEHALPRGVHDALKAQGDDGLPAELWARIVFDMAAWNIARQKGDAKAKEDLVAALGALGMGRLLHFVHETKEMSLDEANALIRHQANTFAELRQEFIDRVDQLRSEGRSVTATARSDGRKR